MKPELIERHPELPRQLLDAFTEANARAASYRDEKEDAVSRREIELLGEDPHQYRLTEDARHTLDTVLDFLDRLGAIGSPLRAEQLFVPSVR